MKQAMVAVVILIALVFAGYHFMEKEVTKDRGHQVGFAIGLPRGDLIELHVIVTRQMVTTEPPIAKGDAGVPDWIEWVNQHWCLRDANGTKLTMNRAGTSPIIADQKAFNPEFFVKADLQKGASYTLEYVPYRAGTSCYRHAFTASPDGQPFQRLYFETAPRD